MVTATGLASFRLCVKFAPFSSIMAEPELPLLADRGREPSDNPVVADPAALPFDSVGAMEEKERKFILVDLNQRGGKET